MALSTALRLLTGVVIFIVMARMWGPELFGSFMYWFTATSLIGLVVDYGFGQQLMREIGHNNEQTKNFMDGVLAAKFILTAAVLALCLVLSLTPWADGQPMFLFWILLATCIVSSFAETFSAVFRGLGQYHEETIIAAWVNSIHFGAVLGLLAMHRGVVAVALAFLVSRLLSLGMALRAYRRLVPSANVVIGKNPFSVGVKHLRSGLAFAAEAGFTNFQSQADTLIVHHFLGAGAVGVYQAGLRLMQGANTFAQVLSNVYMPSMASKVNDSVGFKHLTNRLFTQMLALGSCSLLVFGLGAGLITQTLYGGKFNDLTALLPWFGLLLFGRYIASSHGVTLSAVGLQSTRVVAVSVALVALFIATFFLIPQFQLMGMLYASILAVCCLYLVYATTLVLRGYPLGINKVNAASLIAALGLALFIVLGK
jgi:O-antigen/teichoic acid export membrane protein